MRASTNGYINDVVSPRNAYTHTQTPIYQSRARARCRDVHGVGYVFREKYILYQFNCSAFLETHERMNLPVWSLRRSTLNIVLLFKSALLLVAVAFAVAVVVVWFSLFALLLRCLLRAYIRHIRLDNLTLCCVVVIVVDVNRQTASRRTPANSQKRTFFRLANCVWAGLGSAH